MNAMRDSLGPDKLDWRTYWEIAVRRRWWLMGPLFFLGLLGFAVARLWPDLYRSEALILVEQQKVPTQYVTPNVVADLQDRLQSMTQQILSRTRLERLIEQFNLYAREHARITRDEVIDKMRSRVLVELVPAPGRPNDLTAFRISFSAENPRVAQQVANELTSIFIEENLQARAQQSSGTTNFLENQLEEARKDLDEQERRLREFKSRFLGQLPEQQQSNLQILSSLEAQLHASSDQLERAEQQRIYLESVRAQYRATQGSLGASDGGGRAASGTTTQATLRELRKQLAEQEAKYTAQHPDVIRLKEQIAHLESPEQPAESPLTGRGKGDTGASTASEPADPSLIEIEGRLKATLAEIETRRRDVAELRRRIGGAQSRLSLTPLREQEMADVTRNYENARTYYQSLLQKKMQSGLATNLEKRQQGEQFRLIDPASLPQKPVEPNRLQIMFAGWLLGFCAGIGSTALRELTDTTIRTEGEMSALARLPILVSIPVLSSPREESQQRLYQNLEIAGVTSLSFLMVGTALYTYWVR